MLKGIKVRYKRLQVVTGGSMEYKGLHGAYKETSSSGILSSLALVGNHTYTHGLTNNINM